MYRNVLNALALQSIQRVPNIPDYHLMVGSAEDLTPLPLLVYKNTNIPKEISEGLSTFKDMSNDELSQAISDNVLEVNDINGNIALIGSGLGV